MSEYDVVSRKLFLGHLMEVRVLVPLLGLMHTQLLDGLDARDEPAKGLQVTTGVAICEQVRQVL
jgi:hypothetical protein